MSLAHTSSENMSLSKTRLEVRVFALHRVICDLVYAVLERGPLLDKPIVESPKRTFFREQGEQQRRSHFSRGSYAAVESLNSGEDQKMKVGRRLDLGPDIPWCVRYTS